MELIDRIDGLRPVDAGRLETARLVEQLTPLLISINVRNKAHAGIKITGLPDEPWSRSSWPAEPAARSWRAGCSTCRSRRARRGRQHGDDVEVHGRHVSPDPDLVTYWLADRIDERGYGIRGDTCNVMDALERDRAAGVVSPRRPRPGDVPDPNGAPRPPASA